MLRPYQEKTLARLETEWRSGRQRAWIVLPPGSGKTLVGLEAARRLGHKIVVFAPNTAIQGQWIAHWGRFGSPGTAGADRSLEADVTVLTYQSLAIFDPDAETDEEGHERGPWRGGGLIGRLHDNGKALIEALHEAGPLTLVLDECHHLLDVWGRLLAEVLERIPAAYVIGLTGTPPQSLTPAEAGLVDDLFGAPVLGASIPALVRQGYLAPFAELAWLAGPTAAEAAYIASEAERFAELTTGLTDPGFASPGFLSWIDARTASAEQALAWGRLEKDEPELAAAVLRFHHAGLTALPPGARLREEHRHPPSAEDWVALIEDYLVNCLLPGGQEEAVEAIRRALPAVGYQVTRRGIRAARSPVDRVLARSAAKTHGAVEIAAMEGASLGGRLRCLVLCDHERATATLPAGLRDVLDTEAGSAWLMLANLAADDRTRALAPMLVTGRTVAADPDTAREFAAWAPLALRVREDDGLAVLECAGARGEAGGWSSRTWVPLVTEFFESGRCQVLVGTRALLGEGWDARGVNALVDLTTATTPTSVVQTRGRALRLDPSWPEKAANTWTVVCCTERHPKGAADWERFVRKHEGYLAAAPDGEIVAGVAHVDPAFSPYAPPATGDGDAINAAMLKRADDRAATRASWRLGTDFRDELVHTVRIKDARPAAPAAQTVPAEPPRVVPGPKGFAPVPAMVLPRTSVTGLPKRRLRGGRDLAVYFGAGPLLAAGISAAALLALGTGLAATIAAVAALCGLVFAAFGYRILRAVRLAAPLLDEASGDPPLAAFACAVADALKSAGLSPAGAEAVEARAEPDGSYRFCLAGTDALTSHRFAIALDEVVAPMASPRYVIPRYVARPHAGDARWARVRDWLHHEAKPDGVVYHAVPSIFGQNRKRAAKFDAAWGRWVSRGNLVYAATPEGEGILVTHRGENPLALTTVLRTAWS